MRKDLSEVVLQLRGKATEMKMLPYLSYPFNLPAAVGGGREGEEIESRARSHDLTLLSHRAIHPVPSNQQIIHNH